MSLVVLSEDDVRARVPMTVAIDSVREAFRSLARGDFELPVRTALGEGRALTMSAHHRPTATTVVKSVGVELDRRPAVAGSVSFLSASTSTTFVLDAAAVTSLRTGAVVGVATELLAPTDAGHLVLLGLGAQAADQLRAVQAVRPIQRVTLVDRDPERAKQFRDQRAAELAQLDVVVAGEPAQAVAAADIVCCATPATAPLFAGAALPEVVHVNAIGAFRLGMRELPDDLLSSALVVVDQREAVLEESGEIDHALRSGAIRESDLHELGAVLDGVDRPARTVFKSVGLAIQDWAVAHAVATHVER